ncbi:D-beta-hydroxybutyrate dehydrogenase, mitochondrial-like [Uloborus diversus]|uniref:D-beta-hydroxybutyrate dehydrogenase, mitochondrial-like n=1 Tax=Uloborus diversus TaxID=327109 RepID=UPI0024090781|nr:D-beta-hydroxybutyrate dehydrogenase, mitochondrial-like [Uloborus diversus]
MSQSPVYLVPTSYKHQSGAGAADGSPGILETGIGLVARGSGRHQSFLKAWTGLPGDWYCRCRLDRFPPVCNWTFLEVKVGISSRRLQCLFRQASAYYTCLAHILIYLVITRFELDYVISYVLDKNIQPENRAVLITGCDSGFGHALAKRLDSIGFHVFASCLFPEGKGACDLKKLCSKRLQVLELNVKEDESVRKAFEFVKQNLGTSEFWALVNNAGIQKGIDVELTSMADFKETIEVNTFGMVRVTKAFLPMLRQSRGRVVNLTSLAGRLSIPHVTSYTMSKFAAVAFSECLKQEMEVWDVKVISIEPEMFLTQMTEGEGLVKRIEDTLSSLDEGVKSDYGEKYFKSSQRAGELIVKIASPDVSPVINALEAAVSLEYPRSVYKPCRNIFMKIPLYILERVPRPLIDVLIKAFCTVIGFPKPREA